MKKLKNMPILRAITFLIFFSSGSSYAAFFLEPVFYFDTGESVRNYKSSGNSIEQSNKISTFGSGARFGYGFSYFFLGLEGSYGIGNHAKPTFTTSVSSTDTEALTQLMTFGVIVGTRVSDMRFWVGYNIADNLKIDGYSASDTTTKDSLEGKSLKFGVGYLLSFVSFNLEYLMHSYDTLTIETSSASNTYKLPKSSMLSLTDVQVVKRNALKFSVSFPF